jgi:hypothetical protein
MNARYFFLLLDDCVIVEFFTNLCFVPDSTLMDYNLGGYSRGQGKNFPNIKRITVQ